MAQASVSGGDYPCRIVESTPGDHKCARALEERRLWDTVFAIAQKALAA